jgi:succinate dehydrogenase/fumarate reductase flavoprotein subunit
LKGEEPAAKTPAPTQGGTKKLSLEEIASGGSASTAAKPQPEKLSADNPFAQAVSEKQTQASTTTKQSIETQKTKIQDSISELENKLKILTAVGQRNPEILPDYLRRKMSAYMNATPSRNAKDFEDTKKEIEKLRLKLKSL